MRIDKTEPVGIGWLFSLFPDPNVIPIDNDTIDVAFQGVFDVLWGYNFVIKAEDSNAASGQQNR